ncbi:MAG: proline hydroxylase [Bradyrhizobium sp.]|nr:proline hydroxylase [Bradyrhizobium sp.]
MKTSLAIATPTSAVKSAEARVSAYDWKNLSDELSGFGCTVIRQLLSPHECRQISALYPEEGQFRSHIHMARHGFGKGEYKYFKYPLPDILGGLRTALYPRLAGIANEWNGRMGIEVSISRGFRHFVTSMPAPVASGWSGCRVGLAPTGKRRLARRTGHATTDTDTR